MGARLRLSSVTKIYGEGDARVTAVDDVSLEVAPGEIVLVMGPSGSGKTTLLAMCGALLRPTSGRIWIDDLEITRITERRLPSVRGKSVGFVFQMFNLLENLTALENVRVVMEAAGSPRKDANERARELLALLRLSDRQTWLPEKLSGGERQRVAIARAMANDPPLILADEPTGNLDSRTGYQVLHMLRDLARDRGRTVVIVTHDRRIMDVADRVLWLQDGRISASPSEEAWAQEETRSPILP